LKKGEFSHSACVFPFDQKLSKTKQKGKKTKSEKKEEKIT